MTEALGLPASRGPRILVASAHADDAEIGAGGTIRRLVDERPDASVTWLVLAAPVAERASRGAGERAAPPRGRRRAAASTSATSGTATCRTSACAPKEAIAAHAGAGSRPDPRPASRRRPPGSPARQRGASGRCSAGRRSSSTRSRSGTATSVSTNLYVPLSAAQAAAKVAHLEASFPSQAGTGLVFPDTFLAVLRLRGIECRATDGLAEGFICRKLVVG